MNVRFPWFLRVLLGFAAVGMAYLLLFHAIESRRVAKGPWRVTFAVREGVPSLIVNQPALKIEAVEIVFGDEHLATNLFYTVQFDQARPVPFELPFGRCVFLDATFLPGTVVLEAFGHEIQLLPRTLTIDRFEQPWRSGQRFRLGRAPTR